jgi:hypothetical protein
MDGRIIKEDEEKGILDDLTLRILNNRYTQCRAILDKLQQIIRDIDPEL